MVTLPSPSRMPRTKWPYSSGDNNGHPIVALFAGVIPRRRRLSATDFDDHSMRKCFPLFFGRRRPPARSSTAVESCRSAVENSTVLPFLKRQPSAHSRAMSQADSGVSPIKQVSVIAYSSNTRTSPRAFRRRAKVLALIGCPSAIGRGPPPVPTRTESAWQRRLQKRGTTEPRRLPEFPHFSQLK